MKRALILGIGGMDGSHLADLLLENGYEVFGLRRRSSVDNQQRIKHLVGKVKLFEGDITDHLATSNLIREIAPDEIYNEADQDHAGYSFKVSDYSLRVTGLAFNNIAETIRGTETKLFQPLTSNIFGTHEGPAIEETILDPNSPYACAKALTYHLARFHRRLGVKIYTAIFFNHTSERQSEELIVPKILHAAKRIKEGTQELVELGNLEAEIDIGYSPEFMTAAWKMMAHEPDDYVIGTGETIKIREIVEYAGIPMERVRINPAFFRPANTGTLVAEYSKANEAFGFEPIYKGRKLIETIYDKISRQPS